MAINKKNILKILSPQNKQKFINSWYHKLVNINHFWWKSRFHFFLKQLTNIGFDFKKPFKGLEIGCGNGLLINELDNKTSWIIDAVDLDINLLKTMETIKGQTLLYDINERNISLKEKYDFLILFDVLEHVKDDVNFLKSALFHLKKNGKIFINVPALDCLWSSYDELQGHFRRYKKSNLINLFHQSNIKEIKLEYWGLSFIPFLFLRKIFLSFQTKNESLLATGFKPPNNWVNNFLYYLFEIETKVFPSVVLGSSLLAIGEKCE